MIYQLWGRKRVEMDERKELMERRGGNRAEGGREDEERGHESTRTHSQWLIFIKQRGRGRKGEEGGGRRKRGWKGERRNVSCNRTLSRHSHYV